MTYDGRPFAPARYKQIVSEQVTLGYLTKGGVTYSDSEMMTPFERQIALETVRDLINTQNKADLDKINEIKLARQNAAPKSRLTK